MSKKLITIAASIGLAACTTGAALSYGNVFEQSTSGSKRCFSSNSIPSHSVGQFPNRGNPHSIRAQRMSDCVPLNPVKGSSAKKQRGSTGILLNGVIVRPGTADFYDASSPRGHSRDRSSGWNLEGMGPDNTLGLDKNNAHVDHRGLYHYHGVPAALVQKLGSSHIGYAADGFEIHYVGSSMKSGYELKSGTRPSGPGGRYDGSYVEDYVFTGKGSLDKCNGGYKNGKFVYYATDTYPFFPTCLWGNASRGFGR